MSSQPPASPPEPRTGERIAKLLARAGIASRREVERMIAEGRVARDGVLVDTPATVLTTLDGITVDGQPVAAPAAARLFVYHKPVGLLVTERDPAGRPTIYDRLPPELPRVVPVGRLDLATEGLLLLTTDGGLKRQLELPATGVERTYRARAYGPVTQAQLEELIHGVEIEGMRYGPIDANLERRTGANGWIELTLTEGKNREVRRVLEYLGLEVSRLIRTRYGPFVLGDMGPGDVGEIRQHDLEGFRKTLKSGGGKAVGGALQPVMAEPLAKPAPAVAATERVRSSTRPVRREGSERRSPPGAPSPVRASPNRERPAAADERGNGRSFASGTASRQSRSTDKRDERLGRTDRQPDRAARPASKHDERPWIRPPADDREQPRRGPGRGNPGNDRPREGRREGSERNNRPSRDDASGQPPRSTDRRNKRAATELASPSPLRASSERTETARQSRPAPQANERPAQRPAPSRSDRSPSGDRSRGPAGGRGKPQDPRRPKTPPRGKR